MELKPIREALQEHVPGTWAEDEQEDVVLVGYVVVCEWAGTEGRRWLTQTPGSIDDGEPAPWTVKGWLGHALDTIEDEEDE